MDASLEGDLTYQIVKRTLAPEEQQGVATAGRPSHPDGAAEVRIAARQTTETRVIPPITPDTPTVDAEVLHAEVQVARIQVSGDGTVEVTQMAVTLDRVTLSAGAPPPRRSDPLALDLSGEGLQTTGVGDGVAFDLDADGRIDRASVVRGGTAFLALDANGNGRIDDGRELFGDQAGHANGFEALRVHDDNGDGWIDGRDAVYDRLHLLRFAGDGGQRLTTLAEAGVAALSLAYTDVDESLNVTDGVTQTARFVRTDGTAGVAGDLLLGLQ